MIKKTKNKIQEPEPQIIGPTEGRDELNLIELPFSLVSNDNKQKLDTIERKWTEQGREFYLTISPNVKFGLPTFQTEEITIAALELTYRNGFKNREVHTTKQEMLELLRWHDNGHYRKLLITAFSQLKGISIFTNRFWDHREKKYADAQGGFGIIDDFVFYEDEPRSRGQLALPLSFFRWNQTLWENFQAGYIKRLDTSVYFSLGSNLSRRLYRYVDKWLYQGGQEIDLYKLAFIKLGMSDRYRYPSDVATKLKPAIDELNSRQLAEIRITKSKSTESGYKVVFQPKKSHQSIEKPQNGITEQESEKNAPEAQISSSGGSSDANQTLVNRLIAYKLPEELSQKFIQEKPEIVEHQLEVMDFLLAKPGHGIKNPAGRLRKAIQEEWFEEPEGFIGKDERRRRQQVKQDLLGEYRQAGEKVKAEVGEWAELPPEQRIAAKLDFWETEYRCRHRANPADEERQKRKERYLQDLPTVEQVLASRLQELRQQFEQKAKEQGIESIEFQS